MGCSPMNAITMTRVVLVAALALPATSLPPPPASAIDNRRHRDAVYDYGPGGPNRSYRSGAHTRIYVSKRSWLDGGTEILPGERKFSDYAFPPGPHSPARITTGRWIASPSAPLRIWADLRRESRFPGDRLAAICDGSRRGRDTAQHLFTSSNISPAERTRSPG